MAVDTLEDDLLPIYKNTILLVVSILMAVFDGTEAKLLALCVQRFPRCILQGEDSGVEVGLLGVP